MQITTSYVVAQRVATLAWSAGEQVACQQKPSAGSLFELGWLWWKGLHPQFSLPNTSDLAATGIWNFSQGARFRWLGEDISRLPEIPTGAWRSLFWPAVQPTELAAATLAHTAGWMEGKWSQELAARYGQAVLVDERAIRDLAQVRARVYQPGTTLLTPEQQLSAYLDGFFQAYWQQCGRWFAIALFECYPALLPVLEDVQEPPISALLPAALLS